MLTEEEGINVNCQRLLAADLLLRHERFENADNEFA